MNKNFNILENTIIDYIVINKLSYNRGIKNISKNLENNDYDYNQIKNTIIRMLDNGFLTLNSDFSIEINYEKI